MIKVCTYDSPATMSRECWQEGKLIRKYDMEILGDVPAEYFFFGANIGPWITGQLVGNPKAMEE